MKHNGSSGVLTKSRSFGKLRIRHVRQLDFHLIINNNKIDYSANINETRRYQRHIYRRHLDISSKKMRFEMPYEDRGAGDFPNGLSKTIPQLRGT